LSSTKLKKLHDIRKRKQESSRRIYSNALKELMQAERLLKMLRIRRIEFARAIEERAHQDTQALVEKSVDINNITAGHDAFKRREGALHDMDKDIDRANQHREFCVDKTEKARIDYAEKTKSEKKIFELVSRESAESTRRTERLEELTQDVTLKDAKTGRWNIRQST
jgi:flagellar biosynthesis chaperone FliJ